MPKCDENRSEQMGLPHQMKAVLTRTTKGPNPGPGQPVETLIRLLPASVLTTQQAPKVFVIQGLRRDTQLLLQNSSIGELFV